MVRLIEGILGPVLAQKAKTRGTGIRVVQMNAWGPLGKAVVPAPSPAPLELSPDDMSPSCNGREETDLNDVRKRETER